MEQISFGNKSAAMSSLLTLAQKILGGILTRAEICKLWHTIRLDVVPGIAGLWQIYRCASLAFDDRLRWTSLISKGAASGSIFACYSRLFSQSWRNAAHTNE